MKSSGQLFGYSFFSGSRFSLFTLSRKSLGLQPLRKSSSKNSSRMQPGHGEFPFLIWPFELQSEMTEATVIATPGMGEVEDATGQQSQRPRPPAAISGGHEYSIMDDTRR